MSALKNVLFDVLSPYKKGDFLNISEFQGTIDKIENGVITLKNKNEFFNIPKNYLIDLSGSISFLKATRPLRIQIELENRVSPFVADYLIKRVIASDKRVLNKPEPRIEHFKENNKNQVKVTVWIDAKGYKKELREIQKALALESKTLKNIAEIKVSKPSMLDFNASMKVVMC